MTRAKQQPLPPGSVIGILGGGQLGRMAAQAAAQLGYACHIYCPETAAPAAQVSAGSTVAAYDDEAALAEFADSVDVVTFEFENVPLETAAYLAERVPVRPDPSGSGHLPQPVEGKRFLPQAHGADDALCRGIRPGCPGPRGARHRHARGAQDHGTGL